MLIKLSEFKRILASIVLSAFCLFNTSLAVYATEINQNGVPFQTATTITQNDNIFNISTNTDAFLGSIGVNTFGKFNVSNGDIVNLNLINSQEKLVNLIFDSSASQIDGIVNSYKGGHIGGNVLFANPNGFVVGSTGKFNVGSLTIITPTKEYMEGMFDRYDSFKTNEITKLVSFDYNNDNYYINTMEDKLQLSPAAITINGTINSGSGIDIISGGRTIDIGQDAKLNANMLFNDDTTGKNVVATPRNTDTPLFPVYKSAMNGGNVIGIVSQNNSDDNNYMSAIVNLGGTIRTNGSALIAQTEINAMDSSTPDITDETTSVSRVNVKNGADIESHQVIMRALSKATQGDHDLLGLKSGSWYEKLGIPVECLIDNFVHLGESETKVIVENGANIKATGTTTLLSKTDLSKFSAMTISPIFALDLVILDTDTESAVKSGANIESENLIVQAITDVNVSASTTSTSILDMISDNVLHKGTFGEWGSYAITIVDADFKNKSIIEQGAILNIENELNVLASMTRDITFATKNGFPLVDKNKGPMGLAVGVGNIKSENEAIMDADVDIDGKLIVAADYTGKLTQSASGNSGSPGEDGAFGMGGKIVKNIIKFFPPFGAISAYREKIDQGFDHLGGNSADRLNATFGKIHIAGAVSVAVDEAVNHAYIGHAATTEEPTEIKPTISAQNVIVGSTLTDHKSHVTATSASSNGITAVAGAIAVNIKDLDSDAKAYGDFTIKGSAMEDSQYGLVVRSNTIVERPSMLDSLWNFLAFWDADIYDVQQDKPIDEVNSTKVDDYLANIGVSDDLQNDIDTKTSAFSLLKIFDYLTQELGAEGFFQTYAESSASAAAREGKTSGWAGAFGVTLSDTNSNAELVKGSSVTLNGANANENKVLVAANTDSTVWVGTSLMSIFNIAKIKDGSFAPGTIARDGDATGGSISVLINSADTTAKIGDGVNITTGTPANAGDVEVKATENGQFINLVAGSSGADEAGIAGSIAVSVVPDAITKAAIEQGVQINNAKDVKVDAQKDDNWYSVIFNFSNAKNAVSFGASTLFIFDAVDAYIKGNVIASGDVLVNALYDKVFLNVGINMGKAKAATAPDMAGGNVAPADQENDDDAILPGILENVMNEQGVNLENNRVGDAQNIINQARNIGGGNVGNPDRKSYAYAGTILVNVVNDSVKAYIDDNATIKAGKDVKVVAKSIDQVMDAGTIITFRGDSGGGATVAFDINKNDIDAYIGAATVDAKRDTEVKAGEENKLFSFSAGIGQAKDSSGVGTLSLDIQMNDITAAIKEGAKINTVEENNANQSVKVNADFENSLLKGIGAISLKTGGEDGSAKGAAIDTDAAATNVNAYIKGAEVNASKNLDVTAKSDTKMLDITASGAIANNGGAYDGSVGLYVSTGETNAYMEDVKVNKNKTENIGANVNVSAENNYKNITVTGAIAGGTQNSVGGSIRIDIISDTINSYIKNSEINTTGSVGLANRSTFNSIAIAAAGSVSTSANAYGGAIMLAIDDTTQNSYIDGSTVNAGSVGFDTDSIFKTIAVTGGVTAATIGQAVGGSVYVAVADNDINTYIQNSNVTAENDINLATDFNTDILSVVLSGSGGTGVAASGAINTFINNSNSNTYIKSTTAKEVKSTNGKVAVKGTDDLKFKAAVGNVNVSISNVAAGGSVATVVDNSNLSAGIEGTKVTAATGVEVGANATNDIMSIAVGGSGGTGVAVEGSVNTVVMAADTKAYIKDSDVSVSGGDVSVTASDVAVIKGGTGAASVSISNAAIAASIVTGVINNVIEAQIENSRVVASNDVIVSAIAKESIGTETVPFITVAGGGAAGISVDGVVDTMVINSTADAHIKGTKSITEDNVEKQYGVKANNNVTVSSVGETILRSVGGAVYGAGATGIGATVHTVVIDKDTLAQSENTIVESANISSSATETDKFFTTMVAAGGAGAAGVAGVVNTNVLTSDVKAGFKNSTLTANNKLTSEAKATADIQQITGSVTGGIVAGVGLSAVNNIIRNRVESALDNVTAKFTELKSDAQADNIYRISTASGSGGAVAGVSGVENVNYVNNSVKAYATGPKLEGSSANINAKDKVTFTDSYSGVIAGAGVAGVGATIEVNSVTSTILAYIGGNDIRISNIDVKASGEQNFDGLFAAGFAASGLAAVSGTALANTIETTVKAYVEDNSHIALVNETDPENPVEQNITSLTLNADNKLYLAEYTGAGSVGLMGGGAGATVTVNKIKNTVEAYTGTGVSVNSSNIDIAATSTNNIGKNSSNESKPLYAVAGAGGLYAGIAGTVLYNSIEDSVSAYVGNNNNIKVANGGALNINAADTTYINTRVGGVGLGAAGIGASVGYTVIENTVLAFIGTSSDVNAEGSNVNVIANSNEQIDSQGLVLAGGTIGALSGGVLYDSIGKQVGNASYNQLSAKDQENFKSATTQTNQLLAKSSEKTTGANNEYKNAYNKALDKVANNENTKGSRARDLQPVSANSSLYTKEQQSGSSIANTDRKGTTSAFIDTLTSVKADQLKVNAKNTDIVDAAIIGGAIGYVSVGIAAAISDDQTTTNAFLSNNVNIDVNSFDLKAESSDNQTLVTTAASAGVGTGSGSVAHINSNKTTNTYVLNDTIIKSIQDLLINTNTASVLVSEARGASLGGLAVGVSQANAVSGGSSKIDIGDNVDLTAETGLLKISAVSNDDVKANAWAATGALVGGTGADANAIIGKSSAKDSTVNIGKNFKAIAGKVVNVENKETFAGQNLEISSTATNKTYAEANGRAYGGISAGATVMESNINNKSGVNIADADSEKSIKAKSVSIESIVNNNAENKTYAGAGAVIGGTGSGANINIASTNNVYVGKNYLINTIEEYVADAKTTNKYKSYNEANAKALLMALGIPITRNNINSSISVDSEADIDAGHYITLLAENSVLKDAVAEYDLYGGAAGLASGAGGSIRDNIAMSTYATLGGNKAHANGEFKKGSVNVASMNTLNVTEKADLYSYAAIAGADTDSIVYYDTKAETKIKNKDIKTRDDAANYVAQNDVKIYTKINVESYGGAAGAGGQSSSGEWYGSDDDDENAKNICNCSIVANVLFEDGAKSTSGRDTNIYAINNINLEAYTHARTGGAISILNDKAAALFKAYTNVDLKSGSHIIAYDSVNVKSVSDILRARAVRDAIAYELFGIPYHGSGRQYTNGTSSHSINIDGIVESGRGFSKSLTLNVDGSYDSDGINIHQEKVGEIQSAELHDNIANFESTKTAVTQEYETATSSAQQQIDNATANITTQTNKKNTLEADNVLLTQNIADNTTAWNADNTQLTKINTANQHIYDVNSDIKVYLTTEDIAALTGTGIAEIEAVKTAYEAYISETSSLQQYLSAVNALSTKQTNVTNEMAQLQAKIDADNLTIASNNVQIQNCIDAIANSEAEKVTYGKIKDNIEAQYTKSIQEIDYEIAIMQGMIDSMGEADSIPVFVTAVDDVVVRSGEVNLIGAYVTGHGEIKSPGKATISIENNSVSSIYFKDLIINGNAKKGINSSHGIAGTITRTVGADGDSLISVKNNVDKNDPTVTIDKSGDMVFQGVIENTNGTIDITNYTGSVFTESAISAKNIHIKVPNGGYNQQYVDNEQKIGGTSGTGGIVAAGDIDIAAKTLDVNGLIQSGTELKQVNIPEFTVIKKEDGKYYQVVNNVETEMKKSEVTDGYYYLTLTNDTSDVATLQQIKAYFKPSDLEQTGNDIAGEIYLFKADIQGGNITLTGNIASSQNTGKIVLLNGYGHIDVVNNSNYNLVTSALNADAKNQGKLTINDFKMASSEDATFNNIKQSDLTDGFLAEHSGKYTAYVDENGVLQRTASRITEGNGSWSGSDPVKTETEGTTGHLVTYNTSYIPGNDAYVITEPAGTVAVRRYVPRSFLVELFCGKKYVTVYYPQAAKYGVKKEPIAVEFRGYDIPDITVMSHGSGDIIMNNDITALSGKIYLQSGGNIVTKSPNYGITAKYISINTTGDIGRTYMDGQVIDPIQVNILDGGMMSAVGNNIYLNYPDSDISSIVVQAANKFCLSTSNGKLDAVGKVVGVVAKDFELRADSINFDTVDQDTLSLSYMNVNKIKAVAKDDIYIRNDGDIIISSLTSENNGKISVVSDEGNIYAGDYGNLLQNHIYGGDIVLKALKGSVGESAVNSLSTISGLKIAKDGIYYVQAKNDVNLTSEGAIHVDLIESELGDLNLKADYGIIASQITRDVNGDNELSRFTNLPRVYNLYANGNINMQTVYGNIENIAVNTNGIVNAKAGYKYNANTGEWQIMSALSDINIAMRSEKLLTKQQLNDMTEEELNEHIANHTKDLKLGTIDATQNVTLSGERAVKNADNSSIINGDSITINGYGDLGTEDSPFILTANREVGIGTTGNSSVYLNVIDADKGLKVTKIDTVNGNGSLKDVVITTDGNIVNSASTQKAVAKKSTGEVISNIENPGSDVDNSTINISFEKANITPNIKAEYILLTTAPNKNIGGEGNNLIVETTATEVGKGLIYNTNKAYIASTGDVLNIISGTSTDDTIISSDNLIIASNIHSDKDIRIKSSEDVVATNISSVGDSSNIILSSDKTVSLEDADAYHIAITAKDAEVVGNIKSDSIIITSSGKTAIQDAIISNLNNPRPDELLDVKTLNIVSNGGVKVADSTILGDVLITSKNGSDIDIDNVIANNDIILDSDGDTNIGPGTLTVNGYFTSNSDNTITTGKIIVANNAHFNSINDIQIADIEVGGNMNANAINIDIDEIKVAGNIYSHVDSIDVKSTNDINIGAISGYTSEYANILDIQTTKSVKNGNTPANSDNTNIYAKNINIKASDAIGDKNKPLNAELPAGNKINVEAGNSVNVYSTGKPSNYENIKSKEMNISSSEGINIAKAEGDTLNIKTDSTDVELKAEIKNGTIKTNDKRIHIDNESVSPDYDATAQIHSQEHPMYIGLDATKSIRTNPKNVIRHNGNILDHRRYYNSSMEVAITEASESNIKNTNHGRNIMDQTDKSLNEMPTISDYISNIVNSELGTEITNINGDRLDELNIMDVINTLGAIQDPETKEDKSKLLGYNNK